MAQSNINQCMELDVSIRQNLSGVRFKNTRNVTASFTFSSTEDGYDICPLEPFTIEPYEEKTFNTGVKIWVQRGNKISFASRIEGLYPMNYIQDGGEVIMNFLNVSYQSVTVDHNDKLAFLWINNGCDDIDSRDVTLQQ